MFQDVKLLFASTDREIARNYHQLGGKFACDIASMCIISIEAEMKAGSAAMYLTPEEF